MHRTITRPTDSCSEGSSTVPTVVKANDFPTHSGETSVLVLMNDGRAEELDTVIGEKVRLRTCTKVSDGCGTSWSRDHPEGQSEEWILVGERFWGRMSKIWASV